MVGEGPGDELGHERERRCRIESRSQARDAQRVHDDGVGLRDLPERPPGRARRPGQPRDVARRVVTIEMLGEGHGERLARGQSETELEVPAHPLGVGRDGGECRIQAQGRAGRA